MRISFAGFLLLCANALAVPAAHSTTVFERADFLLSESEVPPGDDAPWQPVKLPHEWRHTEGAKPGLGWYRIRFRVTQMPQTVQAVNVAQWRSKWFDFYLNGQLIGGSRDAVLYPAPPRPGLLTRVFAALDWMSSAGGEVGIGAPVYLTFPPSFLRAGENLLYARMQAYLPLQGLGRVVFGDARSVIKFANHSREFAVFAVRAFLAMAFAAGLITLFMWRARPSDRVMLWFSVACLSWAFAGACALANVAWGAGRGWDIYFPFSHVPLRYLNWGLAVPGAILAMRIAGLRWRAFEILLWVFLAFELLAGLPTMYFDIANAVLLCAAAAVILIYSPRPLRWSHGINVAALLSMALLMLYEVFRYLDWVDVESPSFRPYHVPVMLLAIGAAIFERHVLAVRQAERNNIELQGLVQQKALEIESHHAERQEVTRQQALVQERQRILADMHDGLGGSLLALLTAVQTGHIDRKHLEQQVKDALRELRIAIDALQPVEGDLATVLGNLRQRLEPMIHAAGATLSWDVGELPPVEALDAAAVFSVQRVVLEAITNAVRHSGARHIRLAAHAAGSDTIRINIEDDGHGYQPEAAKGYGIESMRSRAQKLGGSIDIVSAPSSGTSVRLLIPCRVATVSQPRAA
jgi:signal transduction histidine kinase